MKIVWSPLALDRVNEIADRIAQENEEAAKDWLIDIFGAVERLGEFPESGRIVPEVNRSNIREVISDKYRIIYKLEKKQVSVLTVRHGRQYLEVKELKKS